MNFRILFFSLFTFISIGTNAQILAPNSTGSFTYTPTGPLSNQPVEVFYHIPSGDITTMPIVMSFHGATRNGADYRDYWINMADANGFMVFAPEFDSNNYPGLGDNYLMANIFDDGDKPSPSTFNNPDEWTFSVLDPIFNFIVADVNGTQQHYNGWGHSGGAQFLHRFVLYMPNSKLDVAVCSNAGWYTVPETSVSFPYGILNGQLPNADVVTAFSKKLIVHLGQDDNDPNSPGLRHNTIVDNQQGLHRLERGQYFFNTSQTEAQNQNVTFNWEKHEVPNVDHNPQLMANDALPYILMTTLSANENTLEPDVSFYPNPTAGILYFDNSKLKAQTVQVYSLLGREVKRLYLNAFRKKEQIDISDLDKGVYLLKAKYFTLKIIKK